MCTETFSSPAQTYFGGKTQKGLPRTKAANHHGERSTGQGVNKVERRGDRIRQLPESLKNATRKRLHKKSRKEEDVGRNWWKGCRG